MQLKAQDIIVFVAQLRKFKEGLLNTSSQWNSLPELVGEIGKASLCVETNLMINLYKLTD